MKMFANIYVPDESLEQIKGQKNSLKDYKSQIVLQKKYCFDVIVNKT